MGSKKIKINPGDVFVVPLRNKGYGLGLVTRKYRTTALGYFWEELYFDNPQEVKLDDLKKEDKFWIKQFMIRGLEKGYWNILGSLPNFVFEEWEVPKFIREVEPFGKHVITYDDKLQQVEQKKVSDDFESDYPDDGIAAYGLIEIRLTEMLHNIKL